jgi:hypothetical protein
LLRDLDVEAAAFGLATTGGTISHTGVAGLTLGGGIGWLVGKYGMTIDNLLSVDLVTADGEFLTASKDSHPDLFWALRGGGGNFGVVTSFEFQLHEQPLVYGFLLMWPVAMAAQALDSYRRFTESAPDEVTTYFLMTTEPESGTRVAAIGGAYSGDLANGEAVIAPLREIGPTLGEMVGPMPYVEFNRAFDAGFPHGARYYWKSNLHYRLADETCAAIVDYGTNPIELTDIIVIEHYHGAFNRVGNTETAYPHRDINYQAMAIARWEDAADDGDHIAWVRGWFAATEPYGKPAPFLNFNVFDTSDREERIRAGFGENYERLREVKRRYDPTNLFRENANIAP